MAQQINPTAELVPKGIGRCSNYDVLQSIPCSPECKIVGQILLNHPLSYALTATTDVLVVYLQQFWKTYPRFTKLIIAELMKKYPSISPRLEEDYHSIKDDISLVSVYTTGNVTVQGMLIPNAFLTDEIRATDDYKEYETVFIGVAVPMNQPQPIVVEGAQDDESYASKCSSSMLNDDDFGNRLEPEIHKENLEVIHDDDDDNKSEKKDEKKDDEISSLEIRTEKMQTPIPTLPRSPRLILSSNKNINKELMVTVSTSTTTSSKDPHKKRHISIKYNHFPDALPRMCRHQGYMIKDMEKKYVTIDEFWKVHGKVDQSEVPALISKDFDAQAPKIIEERFKNYVQNNVIQVHPIITSSTATTSLAHLQQQLSDDFHSQHHDDHQDENALPEREKKVKRHKTSKQSKSTKDSWVEETIIDEDEVIPEDKTPELITEFQNVDKRVPTIFDRARMEATLNDMLSNQFRNTEEYTYHADLEEKMNLWVQKEYKNFNEEARLSIQHWKDSWHKRVYKQNQRKVKDNPEDYFSNHRITEVVRITTDQQYGLDFMEQILVMRENDKPNIFKKLTSSIEAHDPYSIVDKTNTSLIYLNNKNEKRVMYLVEIVKFCDATLEKVLKEVKLKIFQSEP
ncbi:hypothetical protein Tco_0157796 [Tanacetum coccineum]